jgi:hypothetical protein
MAKWFGSLNNRFMEDEAPKKPEVGMGATALMYSDRHAYTIVDVVSEKLILVQRDKATRTDRNGMDEQQSYAYVADTTVEHVAVRLCKDGRWRNGTMKNGTVFVIGYRDEHYDFNS